MVEFISDADVNASKGFLKALGSAYYKFGKREYARNELQQQFIKVKTVAVNENKAGKNVEKELEILQDKVSNVLDIEKQLLNIDKNDNQILKNLHNKIYEMENRLKNILMEKSELIIENKIKIKEMDKTLQETKAKIDNYLNTNIDRKDKIAKLEKKIKESPERDRTLLSALEQQFKRLEDNYHNMILSGKYNSSELMRVEKKLNTVRDRINAVELSIS